MFTKEEEKIISELMALGFELSRRVKFDNLEWTVLVNTKKEFTIALAKDMTHYYAVWRNEPVSFAMFKCGNSFMRIGKNYHIKEIELDDEDSFEFKIGTIIFFSDAGHYGHALIKELT